MRKIFIVVIFCVNAISFGQIQQKIGNEKIQVLAKFISEEGCDKICIVKYKVLKNFSKQKVSENIEVGFYNYKTFKEKQDTVLLTLENYTIQNIKDYYIFPEYDAKKGIEKVTVNYVSKEYWENCETGKECTEIKLKRETENQKWFLIMPCGGTFTDVFLREKGSEKEIMKTNITHENCPPTFELTEIKDGKYSVNMISCGLGGTIELKIETKK
jgi:hypothetical protein